MRWEGRRKREGAALKKNKPAVFSPRIRGVIFDLDGTIVEAAYDWSRIRADLGTSGLPILSYLDSLEEPERSRKWRLLREYEDEATRKARLKKGTREFLHFLTRRGLKKALVTNNSRRNVRFLVRKFRLEFDHVLSRESGLWKPSGAPFKEVMRKLGLKKGECAVVGDSLFDLQAAEEAGIEWVFLISQDRDKFPPSRAEVVPSLPALQRRFEMLLGGLSQVTCFWNDP
ncbi:MAG: HAD-IA family hydrolase [Clostridiales bacterium]|nr:HAD-IA family hydrolase [Clostridiales bacterium]